MMKLPGTIHNIFNKLLITAVSLFVFIAFALLVSGCNTGNTKYQQNSVAVALPEIAEDYYQNIFDATGITFKHSIGDAQLSNLVESVGGGAAFFDYDQDGYIVIYLSNGTFIE